MHRKNEKQIRNFGQENLGKRRSHKCDGNVNVDSKGIEYDVQ